MGILGVGSIGSQLLGLLSVGVPLNEEASERNKNGRHRVSHTWKVSHTDFTLFMVMEDLRKTSQTSHISNSEKTSHLLIVATSPYYPKYVSAKPEIARGRK